MDNEWTPDKIISTLGYAAGIASLVFGKNILQGIIQLCKEVIAPAYVGLVETWRKSRDRRIAERIQFAELNDRDHKWIVANQDQRITQLEARSKERDAEMRALMEEHINCREETAALRAERAAQGAEIVALKEDNKNLRERVTYLEAALRSET